MKFGGHFFNIQSLETLFHLFGEYKENSVEMLKCACYLSNIAITPLLITLNFSLHCFKPKQTFPPSHPSTCPRVCTTPSHPNE